MELKANTSHNYWLITPKSAMRTITPYNSF